ncbi:uncharacterized protein [Nicotiana sylvestris]|uniref:uncharacterized protein n=1 Tax=Nicotiana sylvestris TaxID=4096 RepID=UPI00388C7F4B
MTNPQDNPGTPPPPTPSNLSTPPPPSTSPKPRLRRVKMLALKTVAFGALSKKLKASQVQDFDSNSDSESYKSESEEEGPSSSDSEKTQESPSKVSSSLIENLETRFVLVGPIKDVELPELRRSRGKKKYEKEKEREGACENVEESGKKSGGSGSGEVAEGLVNLSAPGDEPGSSTEETLADLLKKVGASYDPKKRRTPIPKAPSSPKPSKKERLHPQQLLKLPCQREEPQEAGQEDKVCSESKQVRISEDEEWSGEEE